MNIKCCKDCVKHLYTKDDNLYRKDKFYLLSIDIQSYMCYLIITARQEIIQ